MKWTLVFTVLALGWNNPLSADELNPCKDTVTHTPRAGVEYNPDTVIAAQAAIHGDKDAGGEVDSGLRQNDENKIEIPLTIDVAERYNIDIPAGANFDTNFGTISIYKNGDVFYNGRDISGTIKDVCENERTSTAETTGEEAKDSDNTDTGRKLP